MVEKLRSIDQPFNQKLKEMLERSDRGEHVFNNNILKFHSTVVEKFKARNSIASLTGYNLIQQRLDELGKHTLSQNTAADIQKNMVVHFALDEFYVDANAMLYGVFSEELREAFLKVLRHINPGDETENETRWVTRIIDNMNNYQIYVDEFAKQKWIDENRGERRFQEVRGKVVTMYREQRGLDWCTDVMRVVACLFNRRQ